MRYLFSYQLGIGMVQIISLDFDLKIQKLQTKLDLWKARSLTLFGKVLIIKSLGLSQIAYAASNVNVPNETI